MAHLLPSNPWIPDLAAVVAPWWFPRSGANNPTISGGSIVVTLTARSAGPSPLTPKYQWRPGQSQPDTTYYPATIAYPLFPTDPVGSADGDVYATFKISALAVSEASVAYDVTPAPAVAGIGFVSGQTFRPIVEFGSDDGINKKVYYSWLPQPGVGNNAFVEGAVTSAALTLTIPFYVRLVRADAFTYAELSQTIGGPWTSIGTTAATGCCMRSGASVDEKFPDTLLTDLCFYARAGENANDATLISGANHGVSITIQQLSVTVWPRFGVAPAVQNLRAVSSPSGLIVDLAWTLPGNEDTVRSMSIWRSRYAHPAFRKPDEATEPADAGYVHNAYGELLYEGVPVSTYTDTVVRADRHYYYTIFTSRVPYAAVFSGDGSSLAKYARRPSDTDWGVARPENIVTGYVLEDFFTSEGLTYYESFPRTYRDMDQQDKADFGLSEGVLERYSVFLQGANDLTRGLLYGAFKANDPDQAALGQIVDAAQQQSFVDMRLRDLGVSSHTDIIEGLAKRRLWRFARRLIEAKGTLSGLVLLAQLVAGWKDAVAVEAINSSLHTWDSRSQCKVVYKFTGVGLTYTPGVVSGFTGLVPSAYIGGFFTDFWGRRKLIVTNDSTSITLADSSFVGSDVFKFTATVGGTHNDELTDVTAVIDVLDGGMPNDFAYVVGTDSYPTLMQGTNSMFIVATSNDGSPTFKINQPDLLSPGTQTFYLAYGFGSSSAQPYVMVTLHTAGATLLYNNKFSLADTDPDNVSGLWRNLTWFGLSSGPGSLPDSDVILTAPVGAARFVYKSGVGGSATYDTVAVVSGAIYPAVRPGDWINPNWDQPIWFLIELIQNYGGGNTYYTVRKQNGVRPSDVMHNSKPNTAVIAPRATMERDQLLRSMFMRLFASDCRLFIQYAT